MKYTLQDGSAFTNYSSSCQINQDLQRAYGISGGDEYRHYLQMNAEKVMADIKMSVEKCASCPICSQSIAYKPNGNINQQ